MRSKEKQVGLMVESFHGYGNLILEGIARWIHSNPGWRVAVFDGERADLIKMTQQWDGDGIICTLTDEEFVAAAESRNIPVVNVAGRFDKHSIPSVLGDDIAAGLMAAEYFLDRGFTNFGFVGATRNQFAENRFRGFQQRIEQAGHEVSSFSSPLGEEAELGRWIESQPAPLAVLASTDRRAASVLQACWQSHLNVPEQISVLGLGNYRQLCDLCTPTLSSMDLDMETRGYEAAALLFRLISGDPAPTTPLRIPPIRVVTRRSSDTYAYDDPELGKALRFIQENSDKSIKVTDVVKATKISRRSLENRFSSYFSRTLHEEIWRVHFDRAKLLLTTTDLSLQQVAERSGFRTAPALANLFKLKTGLTPRTYRAEHRR